MAGRCFLYQRLMTSSALSARHNGIKYVLHAARLPRGMEPLEAKVITFNF